MSTKKMAICGDTGIGISGAVQPGASETAEAILLTNDDGYDAPGLWSLVPGLSSRGGLKIAAPTEAQSGVGHRVTTRDPIRVHRRDKGRYAVTGTPADCVRLAVKQLFPTVDWVVAGINPGANLGSDVYQSGTVAAAREAAILGVRSVAVSQYIAKDAQIDWNTTAACAMSVIERLFQMPLAGGFFWNVNLPSPLAKEPWPELVFCGLDPFPHKYDFRKDGNGYQYEGSIHERPRAPKKDVDVCFGGRIAVTRIALAPRQGTADPEAA